MDDTLLPLRSRPDAGGDAVQLLAQFDGDTLPKRVVYRLQTNAASEMTASGVAESLGASVALVLRILDVLVTKDFVGKRQEGSRPLYHWTGFKVTPKDMAQIEELCTVAIVPVAVAALQLGSKVAAPDPLKAQADAALARASGTVRPPSSPLATAALPPLDLKQPQAGTLAARILGLFTPGQSIAREDVRMKMGADTNRGSIMTTLSNLRGTGWLVENGKTGTFRLADRAPALAPRPAEVVQRAVRPPAAPNPKHREHFEQLLAAAVPPQEPAPSAPPPAAARPPAAAPAPSGDVDVIGLPDEVLGQLSRETICRSIERLEKFAPALVHRVDAAPTLIAELEAHGYFAGAARAALKLGYTVHIELDAAGQLQAWAAKP